MKGDAKKHLHDVLAPHGEETLAGQKYETSNALGITDQISGERFA